MQRSRSIWPSQPPKSHYSSHLQSAASEPGRPRPRFPPTLPLARKKLDWLGRRIAATAAIVLTSASLFVLVGYRFMFSDIPATTHALLTIGLAVTAAAYWVKNRSFADLAAVLICLAISISLVAELFIGSGLAYLVLRGSRWIAWGVVSFLIGLGVSLAKGGQIRHIRRALMRLHLAMHGSIRNS